MMQKAARLALVLVWFAFAAQAGAQVSLPATIWSGSAQLKAKIKPRGESAEKLRGGTTYTLSFGPLAAPALAANEFSLELDDGTAELEFGGTYTIDAKGRPVLNPDATAFSASLRDLIDDICLQVATPQDCAVFDTLNLAVTRRTLAAKPRRSKSGNESLKSSGKISFQFLLGVDPVVRVKLRFKTQSGGLLPD